MKEYVVPIRDHAPVTFWRSPRSDRWWLQYPAGEFAGEERHRLLPCSAGDYRQAAERGEMPERLLRGFRRFV